MSAYVDEAREIDVKVLWPASSGKKATDQSASEKTGNATPTQPLLVEFTADREGYHQLTAKLHEDGTPIRGYLKVEYEAPTTTDKY